MPILNTIARAAFKPFPRMISPRGHAIFDYALAASLFTSAGLFWKTNKRAAVGALVCGGAELGLSLLTDYPGGAKKVIHFSGRREIDLGLATMTASMPEFLGFAGEPARKLFLGHGAVMTALSEITRFPEAPEDQERIERRAA